MRPIEVDPEEARAHQLREYLSILSRRKWSIIGATVVVVSSALFFTLRQTPTYASRTEVLVKPGTIASTQMAGTLGPNLETERKLASSAAVAATVAEDLDEPVGIRELLAGVSVSVAADTEILEISYAHRDPREAQKRTKAFADAYLQYRRKQILDDLLAASQSIQQRIQLINRDLQETNTKIARARSQFRRASLQAQANSLVSQVAILQQKLTDLTPPEDFRVGQVVAPATLPTAPASPNYLLTTALGLCVGIGSGLAIAFLRERMDDRIREVTEFERHLEAPVVAVVPRVAESRRHERWRVVSLTESQSAASEAYRSLRTGVLFDALENGTKKLLVTSAHADEGKSTTVANLGVVLAQAGKRVILISADLRKPGLHRFFGMANGTGLTDVLTGVASPLQALPVPGVDNLRLLPSGQVPSNPSELLGSGAMGRALADLQATVDYVIIDAPPLLVAADAVILASLADGVLLVTDAQDTTRGTLRHVRRELNRANSHVVGAVVNKYDPHARTYPYYHGYYDDYREQNGNGSATESRLASIRRR